MGYFKYGALKKWGNVNTEAKDGRKAASQLSMRSDMGMK